MIGALPTVAVAFTVGITATLLTRPVLRRLPEPANGDGKPLYRDLGSTPFLITCGVLAEGDTVRVYYGAADGVTAVADLSIPDILDGLA